MKEKKTVPERTIVIDVKPTRGLVVALSCVLVIVGLLAYLTLAGESAVAAEAGTAGEASLAQSTGMRQFYLTDARYYGDEALTACVAGYHMASMWEIADPTTLKYNTSLGAVNDDSGQGPPTSIPTSMARGWLRTGYESGGSATAGQANCMSWTIRSSGGTWVELPNSWTAGSEDMGVWAVGYTGCNIRTRVWCIED